MKISRSLIAMMLACVCIMTSAFGGTIAWFTDSVESTQNTISSGNLDIKLEYKDANGTWVEIKDGSDPLFGSDDIWEPGFTAYKYLRITNAGNLALKYQLGMSIDPKSVEADKAKLQDVIDVYVLEGEEAITRESLAAKSPMGTLSKLFVAENGLKSGALKAGAAPVVICLALKMQESAGNEYQNLTVGDGIAIKLLATQASDESDSFGSDYDGDATLVRQPLSLAEFHAQLEAANYVFDGAGVTVVLKDSEYNHYNNTVRQYYIPKSTVNINSDVENLTIKNVNFIFEDNDTANTYTAGELQTLAKNVTFEGCTFDNVSVSPWETKPNANDCDSATFVNCTWKDLIGRYGVHQSRAAELVVQNCTFKRCQRGIHVRTVNDLTVTGNTFTGIGDGYGVLCLSEGITSPVSSMNVSNNTAEGQTMLRQLSKAITAGQLEDIFGNNVYGKKFVTGSKDTSFVFVDKNAIADLTVESGKKYALEGDFAGSNVNVVMAKGVNNVVFDGTHAKGIKELIITHDGALIDNANRINGARTGKVTVQNFDVDSQINLFACGTELEIANNTAEALMVYAGNCALNIHHNQIDANFESHPTYRNATDTWNTNNYGIGLNIFDYNLWLDDNTVTDTKGHAIGINGWEGTFDTGDENVVESFKRNNITVNSTTEKRAALKFWDDETYASNDDDTNVVNPVAQELINSILADGSNTFNILDGYNHTIFSFYHVNTNN